MTGAFRFALALVAALTGASAAAQPVSTATLARQELLLEVDAQGEARTAADRVFALAQIQAQGGTTAEARTALERKRHTVLEIAQRLGIPESGIRRARLGGPFGFIGNEALSSVRGDPLGDGYTENVLLEVDVAGADQFGRLQAAFEQADAARVTGPFYALRDDSTARRAARTDALRRARIEAEDYARSLDMWVVRIVRVSERAGGDIMSQTMQAMMQRMTGAMGTMDPEIETHVLVSVDFALAPQ